MGLLEETVATIKPHDIGATAKARRRLEQLTMPHWALGRLMDLAVDLAGITGNVWPPVSRRVVVTFAGDHGVTAAGVSPYPSEVTGQMVANFVNGGAGVNALARVAGAKVVVVDMGVASDLSALLGAGDIVSKRIRPGTHDLSRGPAMSREEAVRSVEAGIEVARSLGDVNDIFGTGDMGIGNTTPSAAIAAVLLGLPVAEVTGRGAGLDSRRLEHKIRVIERALEVNAPNPEDGLDVLAKVGGFEIGGIAGLILGAAAQRKPVLVDGFISTAGALIARALCPNAVEATIAAHESAEPGHRLMLAALGKRPLLTLDMRLGEGTGAALAMPLVEAAARLLTDVSTFEEASVTGTKT